MPTDINLLPEHLINQIAAGEVIENPASVIKELVENSLDAKSTKIEIEIKAGGLLLIRVSDDGIGMDKKNLKLSILRHATSKISCFDDLHKINTMGFRGEALASIASISKMKIESAKENEGHVLSSDGGNDITIEPCARSLGTEVEIKSLFFNVPVRKKFQKSTISLTNDILKAINNLAIANPFIGFSFISDERKIVDVKRNVSDSFKEALEIRVKALLGENIFNYLSWIMNLKKPFAPIPLFSKKNRTGQYLFLNRRVIYSEVISRAIKEGYGTRIDEKDYPVYVLHIDIDPSLVDVNVHPQKKHVRISDEQQIRSFIQRAVNLAFVKKMQNIGDLPSSQFFSGEDAGADIVKEPSLIAGGAETFSFETRIPEFPFQETKFPEIPFPETGIQKTPDSDKNIAQSSYPEKSSPATPSLDFSQFETSNYSAQSIFDKYRQQEIFSPFRSYEKANDKKKQPVIISLLGYFCIISSPSNNVREDACFENSLFAVDLKAASATLFFEKVKGSVLKSSQQVEKQLLGMPILLEFMPDEILLIENNFDLFSRLGFDLRLIAGGTIAVDAIPAFLRKADFSDYLNAILHETALFGKSEAAFHAIEKKLAQKVCKAAKSRKNTYTIQEAEKLIEILFDCADPYHDPLGENTIIRIESDDLSKLFLQKKGEKCHI